MVSTRGVKFKFSEGERVLCYEPDPTKAKVLYESKVLDLIVNRDKRGRRFPEYLIHFFGWNSSWDRYVREEFILPYTEENRELQSKLAIDAAQYLKGKRKGKMPSLMRGSISKKLCLVNATLKLDNDEEEEENESQFPDSGVETSEDEMEKGIEIRIPSGLKEVLELDYNYIIRDKFIKLPCEPNVISILESYVKHLATNLLYAAPPRNVKNGKQLMHDDVGDKLNLCKETMDGLRICFDFTLPHLLLYRQEKTQYYSVGVSCLPITFSAKEHLKAEEGEQKATELKEEDDVCEGSVFRHDHLEADSAPSHLHVRARPSLRSVIKNLHCDKHEKYGADFTTEDGYRPFAEKPPTQCPERQSTNNTRILRSSEKHKQNSFNDATHNQCLTSRHNSDTSPQPDLPVATTEPILHDAIHLPQISGVTYLHGKNIPEFPVPHSQIPSAASNCISSSNSSTRSTMSGPMLEQKQFHLIRSCGVLQDILSWHLIPDDFYKQIPAAPSLIYGAHHLLRLFVKLPDLLSKMNVPQRKLIPLLKILDKFLLYLDDRKDELFAPASYMESNSHLFT